MRMGTIQRGGGLLVLLMPHDCLRLVGACRDDAVVTFRIEAYWPQIWAISSAAERHGSATRALPLVILVCLSGSASCTTSAFRLCWFSIHPVLFWLGSNNSGHCGSLWKRMEARPVCVSSAGC